MVESTYDLKRLLTDQFAAIEQWAAMADSMSDVLYAKVEEQRIGLSLAREPLNIARVFKIMSVKMLGLDYQSSILSDDDYNRLLRFISTYNPEKGTMDFIKFMGFVKNAKLDILPLWTTNYLDFTIGLPAHAKKVYDDPPGPWYPTTHVGLVYDELITQSIDEDELTKLFYKMAPINLVLKWIAAVVTIRLPTLYMAVNALEEDHIQLNVFEQYIAVLYYAVNELEEEEYVFCNAPYEPILAQQIKSSLQVGMLHGASSYDFVTAGPAVYWNKDVDINLPTNWLYNRLGPATVRTPDNTIGSVIENVPRTSEYGDSNQLLGWLFEPARKNILSQSHDISNSFWARNGITSTPLNLSPDRVTMTTKVEKTGTGNFYTVQSHQINQYGSWSGDVYLKQGTSRYAAVLLRFQGATTVQAGIVIDLQTGQYLPINSSALIAYGVRSINGFWNVWIVLDSSHNNAFDMQIHPAWNTSLSTTHDLTAVGWVEAWAAKLEYGSRPTSIIKTDNNPVSRNADNLVIPAAVAQMNQSGFVLVNYNSDFPDCAELQTMIDTYSLSGNYHRFQIDQGHLRLQMVKGTNTIDITSPNILDASSTNKLAYAWNMQRQTVRVFENGTKIFDRFFTPPDDLQVCRFGSRLLQDEGLFGHVEHLLAANMDLTDQELIGLTTT